MGRMGYKGIATPHGFRSLATDVLNENGFNSDVVERQFAQRRNHHGRRQNPRRHLQRRHQPSGGIPTKLRAYRLAAKYRPIRSGKQPPMPCIGRVLCRPLAVPVERRIRRFPFDGRFIRRQDHRRQSSLERMGQTIGQPVVLERHENRLFQYRRRAQ